MKSGHRAINRIRAAVTINVSQKRPFLILNISVKTELISISFGAQYPEEITQQKL